MTRNELVEQMIAIYMRKINNDDWWETAGSLAKQERIEGMAIALDVAVGELLGEPKDRECDEAIAASEEPKYRYEAIRSLLNIRRSRYLKPKSDPAVEAVMRLVLADGCHLIPSDALEVVAAVRNADKGTAQ